MNGMCRAGVGVATILALTVTSAGSAVAAARPDDQATTTASCRIVATLTSFGTGDSSPIAINRSGVVVGQASPAPGEKRVPVEWISGVATVVPIPAGFIRGSATDINDRGQVVGGVFDAAGNLHGFYYDGNSVTMLPSLPGGSFVYARRINASGQIAGASDTADGTTYAVRWDSATSPPVRLEPAAGHNSSFSKGINDRGQVAGDSDLVTPSDFFSYAAVWTESGEVRVYPGIGGPGTQGEIFEINNDGTAAGDSATGTDFADPDFQIRATVWTGSGRPIDLGALPGDTFSEALGLSPDGAAAGISVSPDGVNHAFYWPGHGPMLALPTPDGTSNSFAHEVTRSHVIVGEIDPAGGAAEGVLWQC
jgi:probable HAF family extracellular repeat protein